MTIKDAADLFVVEGEGAKDVLESLKQEAQDALDLVLSEAPEGSQRERYRYVKEQIFPLLIHIEDSGERGATLDDAARRLGLRKSDLRKALAAFEEQARSEQEGAGDKDAGEDLAPEPGTERYDRAMGLLRCPDILESAARDMERLGHVGEQTAKKLAFVCAVSARAGYPIQPSTHAESSTGKNFLWDTVLSLLHPTMVLRWSAMSDKALFFTQEDLKGKVIYLQEVAGSEGADFTIRVLQSAQYLEYVVTEKTPDGSYRAVSYRKEGPVVVVQTTTAIRLFNENDTRVFPIYLDESSEQTERIVRSALLGAESGGISREEREAILELWHGAISLLEPAEVVVPFARRIRMPSHRVRVRRDVNRLLDVIRVLAWLHQHARERDELGRIIATEGDFEAALRLVNDSLKRAWEEMTPAEEAVMKAIESLPEASRKNGFKRSELRVHGHDARRVQEALKALTETGHIECEKKGGPGGYRYTVPRDQEEAGLGISLHAPGDDGPEDPDAEEDPSEDRDTDEEGQEGGLSRGSARNGDRAIESPLSPDEDAIARSRDQDDGEDLMNGNPEEAEVDHIAELTELGWYRAQSTFSAEGVSENYSEDEDPVARVLRYEVGIYKGRDWWSGVYGNPTPYVLTAEHLFEMGPGTEEDRLSGRWPATPEEMVERLEKVIPLLQAGEHRFWDPGYSDWCARELIDHPRDMEKACKEAYLHAERWKNQETGEELWALVALKEGWRVPDEAIEEAVWDWVTVDPDASDEVETEEPSGGVFEF